MRISDWSSDVCSSDLLVGNKSGAPLDQALRKLPGNNLSNAPELVATGSVAWTPEIGSGGLTGLVYVDGRMTSDYNTGSDLFPQKEQDGYAVVNARVGVRGPDERSEDRRVGQECVSACKSGCSPSH